MGAEPPVWRSFLLPEATSFHGLHRAILVAGGWKEGRWFKFTEPEGTRITAGIGGSKSIPDASTTMLGSYFASVGQACLYE